MNVADILPSDTPEQNAAPLYESACCDSRPRRRNGRLFSRLDNLASDLLTNTTDTAKAQGIPHVAGETAAAEAFGEASRRERDVRDAGTISTTARAGMLLPAPCPP